MKKWIGPAVIALYTATVLLIDTLAVHGVRHPLDWTFFLWPGPFGADFFKFTAWFVVPFVLSLPAMDWGYLGTRRWQRRDWWILAGLAGVGVVAALSTRVFPSLLATYHGLGNASLDAKMGYVVHNVVWTLSWLIGWEFLHRYFLLRSAQRVWPRWGWLLIPFFEGVYHLQKPLIEAAGMVIFSVIVTQWTVRRRNCLLPFLAHLIIELELILFLIFV